MPAIAFGKYVLLEKLAMGGMAELFFAQLRGEGGFAKACVIKRVLPHLAGEEGFIEMFLDEARLAARLEHPGIVQLFDLGREGEDYYYAMEYLPGEDLAEVLKVVRTKGTRLPLALVVRIIADAASALHFAHEQKDERGRPLGIVHRDISPSNLLVTYRGQVKVLDFGIARAEARLGHTNPGTVKGKTAYMSPEQTLGRGVDRRSDVWGLGVCLHELLTGRRLFTGDSMAQVALAVTQAGIPRPSALRPDVPPRLDEITLRALERRPADRLSTAAEFAEALEGLLAQLEPAPAELDLGAQLRLLFGDERAEEKLGKATTLVGRTSLAAETSGSTSVLPPAPLPSAELPTVTDRRRSPSTRTSRRRSGFVVTAGGVALLLALSGGVYFWSDRSLGAASTPPIAVLAPEPELAPEIDSPEVDTGEVRAAEAAPAVSAVAPEVAAETSPSPVKSAPAKESPRRRSGSTRVAQTAAAATGFVTVEANVPVRVYLDGKLLGSAPRRRERVTAGRHELRLVNPALGVLRTIPFEVKKGEVRFHRETFSKGELNVNAHPWADVWLNGKKIGQTPLAAHPVWEGVHRVRLVGPSSEKTISVEVAGGQTVAVREELP